MSVVDPTPRTSIASSVFTSWIPRRFSRAENYNADAQIEAQRQDPFADEMKEVDLNYGESEKMPDGDGGTDPFADKHAIPAALVAGGGRAYHPYGGAT